MYNSFSDLLAKWIQSNKNIFVVCFYSTQKFVVVVVVVVVIWLVGWLVVCFVFADYAEYSNQHCHLFNSVYTYLC